MIKKVKNTVPWAYVISDFKGKEIFGMSCENKMQKICFPEPKSSGQRVKVELVY